MKNALKILFVATLVTITSCEINDPIDDWARIGQRTPYSTWELSSNSIKAGDSLKYIAQYYVNDGVIDHTEVWYDLTERKEMSAQCPFVSFNYSLTMSSAELVRENQSITVNVHSESLWDAVKRCYVLDTKFPVSNTLKPVYWKDVVDFDQSKFDALFPTTFTQEFKNGLFAKLELKQYVGDYRAVLVTAANMTVEEFNTCIDSTFNENSQTYDKFVKESAKAALKAKYDAIPLKNLLYKSAESKYIISYEKSYILGSTFRVYDQAGNEGISEKFAVSVN